MPRKSNEAHKNPAQVGVHLVGSIPLSTSADAFTKTAKALPGRLARIPDGEPAERHYFVAFQRDVFAAYPEAIGQDASFNTVPDVGSSSEAATAKPNSGSLQTNYDTHALESYRTFKQLRSEGSIDPGTKLQVCLPTPVNVLCLLAEGQKARFESAYEEALMNALGNIEKNIPHSDLTIQWDVAVEFAMMEGVDSPLFAPFFSPVKEGIITRVVRLVDAVAPSVEVGLHLCYGDVDHQHFTEPKDMALLVEVANSVKKHAKRPITYIHMPVPKARTDDEFFAPLTNLDIGDAGLYLGVVHYDDLEGTRKRIAAAAKRLDGRNFGVATECGMGRTPPEQLDSILEISAAVSAPYGPHSTSGNFSSSLKSWFLDAIKQARFYLKQRQITK
ncbi:hypothetical protein FQN54_006228 [Arachnomyces sp. PD_36]|nr:hypothetical protein FQN54_006228 [Arachnomyces sp. PD_36]